MSRRTDRVGSLLQRELGELILKKFNDSIMSLVTITGVDIVPDLKTAKVYYSVLGKEKEKEEAKRVLVQSTGFLQGEIARSLKLRYTPKLTFHLDESA